MQSTFDDALVVGVDDFSKKYGLPDPNDEHVVAAACLGGAGVIVTQNLRDFPDRLLPNGVEVKPPADFFADTVDFAPEIAVAAIESMLERYENPSMTFEECLSSLQDRYQLDEGCELLRLAWIQMQY